MNRQQLSKLLAIKDRTDCEIQKNDPQLWSAVLQERGSRLRASVLDKLKTSSSEVQKHVSTLDFSQVAPGEVVPFLRRSLEQAGFSPKEIEEVVSNLQRSPTKEEPPSENCQPLTANPEIALLLEKARLFEIASIAQFDDVAAEKVTAEINGPGGISDATLRKLVENGHLTEKQATELGLAGALYQLTDDNAALAAVIYNIKPERLPGKVLTSTKDLTPLRAADWEGILGENDSILPKDVTRERAATILAQRFAALHPDLAFVGRLPKGDKEEITSGFKNLEPLLAKNPKVIGVDFGKLNLEGLSPDKIKQLGATHAQLQKLVRAYPGLRLAEVLDDLQQTSAEKAETVVRRVSLVSQTFEKLKEGELFAMDYAPGSPDLDRLELTQLNADAEEQAMVLSTFKSYQRSYALTRQTDDALHLMERGFTSSMDIAAHSLPEFQGSVAFDLSQTRRYWTDARTNFLDSTLTLSSMIDLQLGLFNDLWVGNIRPDVHDYLRRLDGYETLFGSLSFCTCQHCQSILGPAAYFVDLMKFVDDNIRPQFESHPNHVLDLKTRRPDLWTLDLTCACKDETIPNLDVVNEVLENYTARTLGLRELGADRAEVLRVVYDLALPNTTNSFVEPFHLSLTRIDTYLAKLDSSRAEVVRVLGSNEASYAAAALKISPQEWPLVTRADTDLGRLGRIYGIAFVSSSGTVRAVETQKLLARTSLSRDELGQLVATSFVAAGGASVSIRAEKRGTDSVQNDIENVYGLSADALDRMHRFARLWKKLSWSIAELDRVLTASGDLSLGETALVAVARVCDFQTLLKTSVDETIALFGVLPQSPAGTSLFDRLFNPPPILAAEKLPQPGVRFIHPAFLTTPRATVDPDLPRLLAGIQVDLDGLGRLAKHLAPYLATASGTGFDPAARDEGDRHFILSAVNLTLLYRHARLARALSVSIDALFQLIRFAGLPGYIRHLADLVQLLEIHNWWKDSGYSLDDIAVITGAQPDDPSRYPNPEVLADEMITGGRDAVSFKDTVFAASLGVTEQASRELIHDEHNAGLFVALGTDRWRLADDIDLTSAAISVPGGATVPDPPGSSRPLSVNDVRGVLASYLPAQVLLRRLAAALRISPVEKVQELAALAGQHLAAPNLARALRGEEGITVVLDLITALRPYTIAFQPTQWDATALEMIRRQPELIGMPAASPTVATLRAISAYTRLASRRAGTATNAPPVDAADVRVALQAFNRDTSTFSSAIDAPLARVLGVSPGLVLGLRTHVPASSPAAQALNALAQACLLAQSLGVDGETLAAIAGNDAASLSRAADALVAAYGARFTSEAERQRQISILEEPLRECKRDALVAYLVYSLVPNPSEERPFSSPDELYSYFLIDVQAGGCATTSCIVTAISSVQLYIQRVLMNLEQDRREPSDPEHVHLSMPEAAANEWAWRKNYRVWEANRKVFLWPELYLEPDLRDDKTPLFEELESELLQTDINDQNVLDAYTKYIKGFEEVASLTIAGAWHDVRADADVLHLFGAASTDPPIYYYRTCKNLIASGRDPQNAAAVWSPWRKINVQIGGRRVSPVVFLGRLHVFWTEIRTRPLSQFSEGNSKFTGYQHTMSVKFTSLRADGMWTPPQAVDLPSAGLSHLALGPGRGGIPDTLVYIPPSGGIPHLDPTGRHHQEPIDDYTLVGPNWEWLWLEPVVSGGQNVLTITYRDFLEGGLVDLFTRRLDPVTSELSSAPHPQLLCARNNRTLYYGSPTWWGFNRSAVANAVIEENRLDVLARDLWAFSHYLRDGLYIEPVANLRQDTSLLAVPGSIEDAIAQVSRDIVLLQGSVTDGNNYVAHRIGTTLAQEVAKRLFVDGVDGLLPLDRQRELREASLPLTPIEERIIDRSNANTLDFQGAYGVYYRELFFHIPFLIANALHSRGRFAAAQRWYHYVFDPMAAEDTDVPDDLPAEERARRLADRVWRYLEFRDRDALRLRELLTNGAALAAYHQDPFNPHAIARVRPSAYQKAIVRKYLDNLLDWADYLFTQFTTESVNEALMLYIMAADILGPRPARLGDCGEGAIRPKTYQNIAPTLGQGEEVLIELESWSIGMRAKGSGQVTRTEKKLTIDPVRLVHARERYKLRPSTDSVNDRRTKEDLVRDDVSAGSSQSTPANQSSTVTAASNASLSADGDMFRGLGWSRTQIGGWGPELGASTTKQNGLVISSISEHSGRLGIAEWVGLFGWSIVRQVGPVFCIPANQDLLAYWDRVEKNLYKIRHCMDITGQKRELALFAPEIDPRLLVRMRAAGLTLEDVLGATSGSLPPYRFLYLVDRAKAFAASLSSFGAALLSALEKKDAEEMARLRLVHQQNLSRMTTQLRRWELEVAEDSVTTLERQKEAAEYRRTFYGLLLAQPRNEAEVAQSESRHTASGLYGTESTLQLLAGMLALVGQVGAPTAITFGGVQLKGNVAGFGHVMQASARITEAIAASTGLESGFTRQQEGWDHQRQLADRDVQILDKQIEAARIRQKIAERSLDLHEKSIDQLDEILELTDGKFTNLGRYTWLSTQLRRLYRDAYQNALALARLAEQAFRFERGDETSPGLTASPWDATNAGLLAGEQLLLDLQNLERRFLETNYRSLEVDQAFALSQINPQALIDLREIGECRFTVPELFFDLFYPGHYKRRIKGVRLTIPSVTGPYVNVSATLTLEGSRIRPTPALDQALVEVPPRRSVSVATSTAQNDAGVFELSFRDERYMPFEGAGAISDWSLTLPKNFRQFDYQTITEVILSISYTAEQDGMLRTHVELTHAGMLGRIQKYLTENSVARLFSLRQDFSGAFTRLIHENAGTGVSIVIDDRHFPIYVRGQSLQVQRALVLLRTSDSNMLVGFQLTIDGATISNFTMAGRPGGLPGQDLPPAFTAHLRGAHTVVVAAAGHLAPAAEMAGETFTIDPEKLLDILLYVEFRLSPTSTGG